MVENIPMRSTQVNGEGWKGIDLMDPSTWTKEVKVDGRNRSVTVFEAERMGSRSQADQRLS